jgi:hypothetical protein
VASVAPPAGDVAMVVGVAPLAVEQAASDSATPATESAVPAARRVMSIVILVTKVSI